MADEIIVADSSPLIALALINQLGLLQQLYSKILVAPAVWDEVTIRGQGLSGAYEVSQITWLEIQKPDHFVLQPLRILADRGEAEVIALTITLSHCTVLLDDARVRRTAERLNVKRIGTVGLLRQGKQAGLIKRVQPLLETLQTKGIY